MRWGGEEEEEMADGVFDGWWCVGEAGEWCMACLKEKSTVPTEPSNSHASRSHAFQKEKVQNVQMFMIIQGRWWGKEGYHCPQ